MFPEAVLHLTEIAARQGLARVILSPGSRVAPLTLSFTRHPSIQTISLSDERSAAFTALGMANHFLADWQAEAQETLSLIGIACTSGSAAYNYAPAVAEAFYQEIPLLVMTADRPPEWIGQQDGQAIQQNQIYGNHVKASYTLPLDDGSKDTRWHWERIVNEAFLLLQTPPYGPVHLNIPFREPFYPEAKQRFHFPSKVQLIQDTPRHNTLTKPVWNQLLDEWDAYPHKLIVAGQMHYQPKLIKHLRHLSEDFGIPIMADITANWHSIPNLIQCQDLSLAKIDEERGEALRPDLLITFGKSVLSKPLKLFLRKYQAEAQWHIQAEGLPTDVFQSLSRRIAVEPDYFFKQLFGDLDFLNMLGEEDDFAEYHYQNKWQQLQQSSSKVLNQFLAKSDDFSELKVCSLILENIPINSNLHLANSMPVRYFNMLGLDSEKKLRVFANRGTSGIDGSSSTAVGAALVEPNKLFTLITGDLAFFYDLNAFWNNHLPNNLRIILLNNGGGNIFRMIKGPSDQAELEPYFETFQKRKADSIAQNLGLDYYQAQDFESLQKALTNFYKPMPASCLLEIKTDKQVNAKIWENLKTHYQNHK